MRPKHTAGLLAIALGAFFIAHHQTVEAVIIGLFTAWIGVSALIPEPKETTP